MIELKYNNLHTQQIIDWAMLLILSYIST